MVFHLTESNPWRTLNSSAGKELSDKDTDVAGLKSRK